MSRYSSVDISVGASRRSVPTLTGSGRWRRGPSGDEAREGRDCPDADENAVGLQPRREPAAAFSGDDASQDEANGDRRPRGDGAAGEGPRHPRQNDGDRRRGAHNARETKVAGWIGQVLTGGHAESLGDEQADHGGENDPSSMGHRREYQRDARDKSVRSTEDGSGKSY